MFHHLCSERDEDANTSSVEGLPLWVAVVSDGPNGDFVARILVRIASHVNGRNVSVLRREADRAFRLSRIRSVEALIGP